MENASKALIIAGAILLAIVIISLGLIVVNNTRNTVDTANLNEQETQAFNAKFTSYEGKMTGARVNSLIQTIISSNQSEPDDRLVTLTMGGNDYTKASTSFPRAELNKTYTVTLTYGTNSLVSKITVA